MKKMILIIAMVVTGLTVNAQNYNVPSDVPSKVSTSLIKKYPEAKDVNWNRTGALYKAKFSLGEKDYGVVFDTKGNWISTGVEDIPVEEMPMSIQTKLNDSEYRNWQVGKLESSETAQETTYKVPVRKGLNMRELYFDDEGNMIRDKGKM